MADKSMAGKLKVRKAGIEGRKGGQGKADKSMAGELRVRKAGRKGRKGVAEGWKGGDSCSFSRFGC